MPKKRRSTKSRIIKAAWNLFYKNGYEHTTVDEIIAASKTSKGTFYHYFKGKEALLNTLSYLFDEKYEELSGSVEPSLSVSDKLLFFNHELFKMIEESVDVNLLASLYSSQLSPKTSVLFWKKIDITSHYLLNYLVKALHPENLALQVLLTNY